MKKTAFLLLSFLIFTNFCIISVISGQDIQIKKTQADNCPSNNFKIKGQKSSDTIWYESFANGIPAGWQVYDSTGNNFNWIYSHNGPTGAYTGDWPDPELPIQSSTFSNGFLMLPSDFYNTLPNGNPVPNQIDMNSYIQSGAINCSGYDGIVMSFQQKLRYCCNSIDPVFYVMISTDGINWTSFDVRNALLPYVTSPDPDTVRINISSIAGNQPTVYFRFYEANERNYYWMIDDVLLTTAPANDIVLNSANSRFIFESPTGDEIPVGYYTRIPKSQAMPVAYSGKIHNFGNDPQHNISYNVNVENDSLPVFNGINTISLLMPDSLEEIALQPPYFIPSDVGHYTVSYNAIQDETDEEPWNNSKTGTDFKITTQTFARDSIQTGKVSVLEYTDGTSGDFLGVRYHISKDVIVHSVSVFIDSITTPYTTIIADIFLCPYQGNYSLQIQSQEYEIQPADLGTWIELPLIEDSPEDALLTAHSMYFAGIEMYMTHLEDILYIGFEQSSLHNYYVETALRLGSTWYWIYGLPMIRLNIDTCGNLSTSATMASCFNCADGSVDLTVNGGTPPFTYIWSNGTTTQNIDSIPIGIYQVTVTDMSGCILNYETEVISGINNNATNHATCMYQNFPNPFSEFTYIPVAIVKYSEVDISVYTIDGKKTCTLFNGHLETGYHVLQFNSEVYEPGIYLVRFISPESRIYRRISIVK